MISLIAAVLAGNVASADELVEVQLTAAQRERLIHAPAEHMNSPPSSLLQQALDRKEIDRIKADAEEQGKGTIQGWLYYAPNQISEGRTYHPRVICLGNGEEIEWEHCQDESYTLAYPPGRDKPIKVSDTVDNTELQRILEFVQGAELKSPKNNPILAANVYEVVRYRLSGNLGVFASTQDKDDLPTVFLRPVAGPDGPGTYEITELPCN